MIRTAITHLAVRLLDELLTDESEDVGVGLAIDQDLLDALCNLRRKIDDYLAEAHKGVKPE